MVSVHYGPKRVKFITFIIQRIQQICAIVQLKFLFYASALHRVMQFNAVLLKMIKSKLLLLVGWY